MMNEALVVMAHQVESVTETHHGYGPGVTLYCQCRAAGHVIRTRTLLEAVNKHLEHVAGHVRAAPRAAPAAK
jgi:hypothetical protein